MYPNFTELIGRHDIFGQDVPAYFVMLMVGFVTATLVGARAARRQGLDHQVFIDLGLVALVFGVLGGRLLHLLADGYFWDYVHLCTDPSQVAWQVTPGQCRIMEGVWDAAAGVCHPAPATTWWKKLDYCTSWAQFWRGGLAYYGGLIAAVAAGMAFLRREGFPLGKGVDLAGMVLPLGLFFGRMGCFLGGCCFGTRSDSRWAVSFPAWSSASMKQWREGLLPSPHLPSLPVHAAQLYEAFGCLVIAAFLILGLAPRKRFDGQVMLAFLALYAVLRFGLEFVRADDRGGALGLSTSQLIGLVILAGVAVVWPKLRARARPLEEAPTS